MHFRGYVMSALFLVFMGSCYGGFPAGSASGQQLYYPKTITLISRSDALQSALDSIELDSTTNTLSFRIHLHLDSFPFPEKPDTNDVNFYSRLFAEITMDNGEVIASAGGEYARSGYGYLLGRDDPNGLFDSVMRMETSFIEMKEYPDFYFEIPLLAFSCLPAGNNHLRIHIWQKDWAYRLYPTKEQSELGFTTHDTTWIDPLIECTASFNFYRRQVLKTYITCEKMEVSSSWDFGSGSEPDVYWTAFNKTRGFRPHSPVFENSPVINQSSTLRLYYLIPEDSIFIQVMDVDGDTDDDLIGTYATTVAAIPVDSTVEIRFDSVNVFVLRRQD